MKILVVNSGSSSIKYQLFDMSDRNVLAGGAAERIGGDGGRLVHRDAGGSERQVESRIADHRDAFDLIAGKLSNSGVVSGAMGLSGIGHRVVHGGETFKEPTLIDERVVEAIRELSSLAPLHNPANLLGIEIALERSPDVPQVAVFDTAFHHTIPPRAYHYAVPCDWYESHQVRRYGFHGTSHAYVAKQSAVFIDRPLDELNLIVLHLGNGASATAIAGGKSVDTSMGLTPLEGLVMGTRSGDLDPAVIFHVARRTGMPLDELDAALSRKSGLKGLCGASDMRDALAREEMGDALASLAIDVYTYRIRKYIGAYMATLGRVDAIVFTGGVGENSHSIRERSCNGLAPLGIRLDPEQNRASVNCTRTIHADDSIIQVLVVPTNEELEIAEQTLRQIQET